MKHNRVVRLLFGWVGGQPLLCVLIFLQRSRYYESQLLELYDSGYKIIYECVKCLIKCKIHHICFARVMHRMHHLGNWAMCFPRCARTAACSWCLPSPRGLLRSSEKSSNVIFAPETFCWAVAAKCWSKGEGKNIIQSCVCLVWKWNYTGHQHIVGSVWHKKCSQIATDGGVA